MKVTLKLNSNDYKWFFYLAMAVVYAAVQVSMVMYPVLLVQLLFCLQAFGKKGNELKNECVDLILVSLILPDNYCVILTAVLVYLVTETQKKVKLNTLLLIAAALIYLLLGLVIHKVRMPNVLMSLLYMLPFWLQENSSRGMLQKNGEVKARFYDSVKKVILIEVLATAVYALTHMQTVAAYADMDWVTGTLGVYQCNVLMFLCSVACLVFWAEYENGKKTAVVWLLLSGALALATGAVAYTLVFAVAVALIMLTNLRLSFSQKVKILVLILVAGVFFVKIMPEWIVNDILKMTNREYLLKRFAKLNYYRNTFVEIPKNEGSLYFMFGTGLGQYSSRAAATCAGGYIGIYDRFIAPYETVFRQKYISSFDFGEGILALPYASVMSLQGEVGLAGLAAVLAYFVCKFRKAGSRSGKIAIVYFVGLMFFENTLEFAKYGAMLWLAYYGSEPIGQKGSGIRSRR